jgi:HSP20 family protein
MNTAVTQEEQTTAPAAANPTVETEREYIRPAVDIFETTDGYVLEAELPGVNKDGLSVSVEGNFLTVEGRRAGAAPASVEPLYRESRSGDFYRVFQLDPAIDTGKVSAKIEQGILTVTLPRSEAGRPRAIAVA